MFVDRFGSSDSTSQRIFLIAKELQKYFFIFFPAPLVFRDDLYRAFMAFSTGSFSAEIRRRTFPMDRFRPKSMWPGPVSSEPREATSRRWTRIRRRGACGAWIKCVSGQVCLPRIGRYSNSIYIYTRVYRYMYIYRTELFQSISSNSFYRYRFISLDLQQLLGCALGHCYKTRFWNGFFERTLLPAMRMTRKASWERLESWSLGSFFHMWLWSWVAL